LSSLRSRRATQAQLEQGRARVPARALGRHPLLWSAGAVGLALPRHHHKDHGFGAAVFGATLVPDPSADAFVSFVTKHNKSGSDLAVSVFEDMLLLLLHSSPTTRPFEFSTWSTGVSFSTGTAAASEVA
jgi:hypothetical protein